MKSIIKVIHKYNENIVLKPIFVDIEKMIELVLNNKYYMRINKFDIKIIKDYNAKEKLIIDMFVNNFIYFNLLHSKYNKYIYYKIIKIKSSNLISYNPIFSGFYVAIDILYRANISREYNNILQIGILPSFLEAYLKYCNRDIIGVFLKLISLKHDSKLNYELYNNLIEKFRNKYNNINNYEIDINFSNDILKNRYFNLIIFNIYKYLSDLDLDNLLEEYNTIKSSYFESLISSKYILKGIIYSLNHLEKGGDLILLFPGYENKVYEQLIKILTVFFAKVELIISSIDFSYRYFVVCHNFKYNSLLSKLMETNFTNGYIINLFDDKHVSNYINIKIYNKFKNLQGKISELEKYYDNYKLINKLYDIKWCIQLYKTYNWISKIYNKELFVYTDIKIYNYFVKSLINMNKYIINKKRYIYTIKSDDIKFNILNIKIYEKELKIIFNNLKYLKLFNLIIFTRKYTYKDYIHFNNRIIKNDLVEIINYLNIKDITKVSINHIIDSKVSKIEELLLPNNDIFYIDIEYYLHLNNKINILKYNNNIIILKFRTIHINTFLLSIIYIYSKLYDKVMIYYPKDYVESIYFLCINRNKINIDKLINYLELNLKNIDKNLAIVSFSEIFVERINNILYKLIYKQLLLAYRLKAINKIHLIINKRDQNNYN